MRLSTPAFFCSGVRDVADGHGQSLPLLAGEDQLVGAAGGLQTHPLPSAAGRRSGSHPGLPAGPDSLQSQ